MVFITYNVNGIRAALRKNWLNWLLATQADILGLQEVKAEVHQIDVSVFQELGYHIYWSSAQKKGYSGVAVLSKHLPLKVETKLGFEPLDQEGRLLVLHFENTIVVNAYFPTGSNDERMVVKIQFLHYLSELLQQLEQENKSIVVMGDFNIARNEQDVFNPVYAQFAAGYSQPERTWMQQLIDSGYADTFRRLNKSAQQFTWWSYMANARSKNLGWRIDYILAKGKIVEQLSRSTHLTQAIHSDHCPVRTEFSNYSI